MIERVHFGDLFKIQMLSSRTLFSVRGSVSLLIIYMCMTSMCMCTYKCVQDVCMCVVWLPRCVFIILLYLFYVSDILLWCVSCHETRYNFPFPLTRILVNNEGWFMGIRWNRQQKNHEFIRFSFRFSSSNFIERRPVKKRKTNRKIYKIGLFTNTDSDNTDGRDKTK